MNDSIATADLRAAGPLPTLMHREACEAGAAVAHMLERNAPIFRHLATELARRPSGAIVTCGRGSSDNASTYGRHLFATMLGMIGASASPSVSSVYGRPAARAGDVFIAVSQSGRSPDLIEATRLARRAGALTVGFINDESAPLANEVDELVVLAAGPEQSVAATKSFICAQAAFAGMVSRSMADKSMARALDLLPEQLDRSFAQDWSHALERLKEHDRLFVLARGPALGTAQEAALKLKEVASMHAEAFSSAEVLHGPITVLQEERLTLIFSQDDAARRSVEEVAQRLIAQGVIVLLAGQAVPGAVSLPTVTSLPELDPILAVQSFYRMVADLSLALGFDPDRPQGLSKITKTI